MLISSLQCSLTLYTSYTKVLCIIPGSRDLDILRAQRIVGFYLNYPQINEVRKCDHMEHFKKFNLC